MAEPYPRGCCISETAWLRARVTVASRRNQQAGFFERFDSAAAAGCGGAARYGGGGLESAPRPRGGPLPRRPRRPWRRRRRRGGPLELSHYSASGLCLGQPARPARGAGRRPACERRPRPPETGLGCQTWLANFLDSGPLICGRTARGVAWRGGGAHPSHGT